jgi:hypothetical protein
LKGCLVLNKSGLVGRMMSIPWYHVANAFECQRSYWLVLGEESNRWERLECLQQSCGTALRVTCSYHPWWWIGWGIQAHLQPTNGNVTCSYLFQILSSITHPIVTCRAGIFEVVIRLHPT